MPNEINQELVKAFNIILAFDETAITNLAVKSIKQFLGSKDHIVISFDKDMNVSQRMKYLRDIKDRIIEKFCGDESAANKFFDTRFFPLNFDKGEWTEDNKFLVPMKDEVVYNLKYLLANNLAQFAVNTAMKDYSDPEYVEENISDESFDRKSYLHCIRFCDQELQNSFVEALSSEVRGLENGPLKDFFKIKKDRVYIKKGIFDNSKFIKDIVMDRVSRVCRSLDSAKGEIKTIDILKFAVLNLISEALPHLPIRDMWHTSHVESEDEYSILAPVIDRGEYMGFLNEREVDHINSKVFGGTEVLCDLKDYIAQKNLPTYGSKKIYAIDFAEVNISYCVMNKIIETSVINKEHGLSIDLARVPKLLLSLDSSPPRIPPQEKRDNGISDSPPKSQGSVACSSSDSFVKLKSPKRKQSGSMGNCNNNLDRDKVERKTYPPQSKVFNPNQSPRSTFQSPSSEQIAEELIVE